MSEKKVTLAHGAGGAQTNELIDSVFKAHFANPMFTGDDAAVLPQISGKIATSTDGFIVSPNVSVNSVKTMNMGFEYSDHNPVELKFTFEK